MYMSQVQGYIENFSDSCKGPIGWIADMTLYLTFTEGWALYSENPLVPEHTTAYETDPISKYGMLKWQVSSTQNLLKFVFERMFHYRNPVHTWSCLAFNAGVFLASKRSVLLRDMVGHHLGFFKQRKVGEGKKFLPRGSRASNLNSRSQIRRLHRRLDPVTFKVHMTRILFVCS